MRGKKRAALLLLVPFLGACGLTTTPSTSNITEIHQKLDNGKTVDCLIFAKGYKGGLSCDWGNAK